MGCRVYGFLGRRVYDVLLRCPVPIRVEIWRYKFSRVQKSTRRALGYLSV